MSGKSFLVSCVIPVYNESSSVSTLVQSIGRQTEAPAEIIIVDGGSTDDTVRLLRQEVKDDNRFVIIEAGRAMPGKGRNIGAARATNKWIVFTDAGIRLDDQWLETLVNAARKNSSASIVYGNFSPVIKNLFDKCASISYVPPLKPGAIRTKTIVSCLLKKEVWEKAGGFPDWRASEDLIFMEHAEKAGYSFVFAPEAMAYWQLRPDLSSTYQKFKLYSTHNVWAGRQAYWHYGVARQYALLIIPLLMAFLHSAYWLLLIPAWIAARVAKRIFLHRYEFGAKQLLNPAVFFGVMVLTLTIDAATFAGWIKAASGKKRTSDS